MGLRKRIDLETHRGRERAKDIIAKMPNLNRHDIFGGAPGYNAGGASPDFGFTGYDPGCLDCLPECDSKSLKLCVWPHGEVWWPADLITSRSVNFNSDAGPKYSLRYVLPIHRGIGVPTPEGQSQGYEEIVPYYTYSANTAVVTPSGSFGYPSSVEPAQCKYGNYLAVGGFWKGPGDDRLSPWRPLSESPFGPIEVLVTQHDFTSVSDTIGHRGSNDAGWASPGRSILTGNTVSAGVFQGNGGGPWNAIAVPIDRGFQVSIYSPSFESIDFSIPVDDNVGALDGHSLYVTAAILGPINDFGVTSAPTCSMFLGSVRGCSPPAGSLVDDDVEWVRNSDGSYHPPTPAKGAPLAVYYDGLLAIPAVHYTLKANGDILPTTDLIQGTKVVSRYYADGNDNWP